MIQGLQGRSPEEVRVGLEAQVGDAQGPVEGRVRAAARS